MSFAYALRRPAVRRALSRAAANLAAVAAVTAIFALKAYVDARARDLASLASTQAAAELAVDRSPASLHLDD
ncbi:hypothetical protein [Amphiplicatus metriothermophilus]|uniref:Uncharacterized protein n=1 Tax=Amphiplicatus metriothermophilus TaxID=1519374 RepID=A0A239PJZ0_9PROT|nr:hypothetical protein [Amphiplicatus metriothermophilus]MBB5518023.1 hypothetical protein [Amphiplicatus metriothermophilus]SNT67643.1 hypothetical protein SAMN06297382_0135 [Amphiplicatus metriothermophilus]